MSSWKRHDGEMKYDKKELGKDVLQIYVPIVSSLIEKINKRNNYNILKDIILWQRLCNPQNILNSPIYSVSMNVISLLCIPLNSLLHPQL